jgi:hypothetical protein
MQYFSGFIFFGIPLGFWLIWTDVAAEVAKV